MQKSIFKKSEKKGIFIFVLGLIIGISIPITIQAGNDIDLENGTIDDFYRKFSLSLGGYTSYYILLAYTIIFPITLLIPSVGSQIKKKALWIRFLAGTSVGFGIMQFVSLNVNGLSV